jgi:hypothetical protein
MGRHLNVRKWVDCGHSSITCEARRQPGGKSGLSRNDDRVTLSLCRQRFFHAGLHVIDMRHRKLSVLHSER